MEELQTLNQNTVSLENMLRQKHQEKESWFTKRQALQQEIKTVIDDLKKLKKEVDGAKAIQNQWKTERNVHNQQTRELITQIKPLQEEKTTVKGQHPWMNIIRIQKTIERIDTKIETEALEFEKEKQLMAKIKKLKKQLDEQLLLLESRQQYYQLSKDIREAKRKADECHKKFEEERNKQQENIEQFAALTKKITSLRKLQEEAHQQCIKLKGEYAVLAQQLKESIRKKTSILQQQRKARQRQEQERREKRRKLLEEKSKDVEEKIKKGKKLTTEDIIAFQGINKDQ